MKKIQDHTTEIKNTGRGSIKDSVFKYETNKELAIVNDSRDKEKKAKNNH